MTEHFSHFDSHFGHYSCHNPESESHDGSDKQKCVLMDTDGLHQNWMKSFSRGPYGKAARFHTESEKSLKKIWNGICSKSLKGMSDN